MTVKLAHNGSVLAQNAVIYSQCLQYQKDVPLSMRPVQELEVRIGCCRESKCNAPKKYRWNQGQKYLSTIPGLHKKMDDQATVGSIANSPSMMLTPQGVADNVASSFFELHSGANLLHESDFSLNSQVQSNQKSV